MDRTFPFSQHGNIAEQRLTLQSPLVWFDQLVVLDASLFGRSYDLSQLQADVQRGDTWVDVLVNTEGDLGFVVAYGIWQQFYDEMHVIQLATHPDWQRKGLARQLLQTMETRAREQTCATLMLEVRVSNHAAIALYKAQGFSIIAERPAYYANNRENAYLLRKVL